MKDPHYAKWMPMTETSFYVLIAMLEAAHGYAVMQKVEAMTNGRIVFGPGSLYGAINNLLSEGLIELVEGHPSQRKKTYRATEFGRMLVRLERNRLSEMIVHADKAIGESQIDQRRG